MEYDQSNFASECDHCDDRRLILRIFPTKSMALFFQYPNIHNILPNSRQVVGFWTLMHSIVLCGHIEADETE